MSDKYTSVESPGCGAIGLWGHVDRAEALDEYRSFYAQQILDAERALNALASGDVQVHHQLGPWAEKNRHIAPDNS